MKKNYLFGLLSLFTVLFAASCQEEDIAGINAGNSDVVTFAVNLQQTATTRAELAGKGSAANKLYYGVYEATEVDADGKGTAWQLVSAISAAQEEGQKDPADISSTGNANVEIKLAKQKLYSVIFWATNENNDVCDVNWANRTMTMTDGTANNEANDAFWAYETVKLNGAVAKTVDLYRPFAQLNIGASDQDILDAAAANVVVSTSQIVLKKVANTFNMETGVASGNTTLTYDYKAIPNSVDWEFPVDEHQYLALGYVLVDATKALVDVELAYKDTMNNSYNSTFTSVPVQRNYRTNIYGNLLSNSADYNVNLKPELFTPDENIEVKEVATASDLQSTINNMEEDAELTIVLTDDIDLSDLFGGSNAPARTRSGESSDVAHLAAGRTLILDLNGKTITATENSSASFAMITNQGNLTINDVTGEGAIKLTAKNNREWNAYSSVISNQPGGKLTVNGGTIEHCGGTDMAYAIDNLTNGKGTYAETIINGGVIKSTYRPIRMFLNGVEADNILKVNAGTIESTGRNKAAIWMQDPSANANTGTLYVGAGAVINNGVYLDVTEGSTEWPVTVSIAADALKHAEHKVITENLPVGYSVEEIDGVYKVVITYVAKIGEVGYTTLKKAVDAVEDGGTITLVADETFTKNNYSDNGGWKDGIAYSGDKSFTIDLNGYTVSQNGYLNDYLFWFKNAGSKENTITIKNGTLDAGTTAFCALCTANAHDNKLIVNTENVNLINNISNGSTVKIRAGSVYNAKAGTKITGKNSYLGIENWNATVNIYDGAEIYMNGTSSYNGCLVGVGGNGTVNVYGGYGKGVSGGLIAMTSGGTINVEGGEWIANTDGTFANSNKSVLIARAISSITQVQVMLL